MNTSQVVIVGHLYRFLGHLDHEHIIQTNNNMNIFFTLLYLRLKLDKVLPVCRVWVTTKMQSTSRESGSFTQAWG